MVGDVYEAVSVRCCLGRDSPNRTSNTQPLVEIGERIREMQHDAARGGFDPDSEFEKPLAQRADLRSGELSNSGAQAQFLPQYIGSSSEQHAQLVGQKTGAARAIDLQSVVQLLDAILHIAPIAVDSLVKVPRGSLQVGYNKPLMRCGA
jgi:hypothetical protein